MSELFFSASLPHYLPITMHHAPTICSLGYGNVGFNRAVKDDEVKTPHLDSLVSKGVRLSRHYVHRFCTPSRTSLQCGRLPVHVNTGLGDPCADTTGIPQNMTGLAEHLKAQGYVTGMAGKWDAVRLKHIACLSTHSCHSCRPTA